jgi:hypothetical protein
VATVAEAHRTERRWLQSYVYSTLVLAVFLLLCGNAEDTSEIAGHSNSITPFTFLGTFLFRYVKKRTASVVQWPELLATDPEVPGSILGAARFSEK